MSLTTNSIETSAFWDSTLSASVGNIYVNTTGDTYTFRSVEGKALGVKTETQEGVHPRLVFKFLKHKLNKAQKENLEIRARELQKFVRDAEELGQQALFEEFSRRLLAVVRVMELQALGYHKWVDKKIVTKFSDSYKEKEKVIKLTSLENFPRAIPSSVKSKIKAAQNSKMFSEFHVLYLDLTKEKLKTNKDKIREKDPILFGVIEHNPEKYFYICDWVDEYCDLTLDKFLTETNKHRTEEYELEELPELDQTFIEDLRITVEEQAQRLKDTNPRNFKEKMKEEDRSWWQRMWGPKK